MGSPTDLLDRVRDVVRTHAPRCSVCDEFHSVDTATQDWRSCVLSFRHTDGWLLHNKPCAYSDAITTRYGTNQRLHELAQMEDEEC